MRPVVDESIASAEARVLGAALSAVQSDMHEVKDALLSINQSLLTLATVKTQYENTVAALTRAFDEIQKTNTRHDALDKRVQFIEVSMPGLIEARKWIVALGLGAVTMLLLALVALVLNRPTVQVQQIPMKMPTHEQQ